MCNLDWSGEKIDRFPKSAPWKSWKLLLCIDLCSQFLIWPLPCHTNDLCNFARVSVGDISCNKEALSANFKHVSVAQ